MTIHLEYIHTEQSLPLLTTEKHIFKGSSSLWRFTAKNGSADSGYGNGNTSNLKFLFKFLLSFVHCDQRVSRCLRNWIPSRCDGCPWKETTPHFELSTSMIIWLEEQWLWGGLGAAGPPSNYNVSWAISRALNSHFLSTSVSGPTSLCRQGKTSWDVLTGNH